MYMYQSRGTQSCRNGPNCRFLSRGNCWFYHPQSHSRLSTLPSRTIQVTRRPTVNSTLPIRRLQYYDEDEDWLNNSHQYYGEDEDWLNNSDQSDDEVTLTGLSGLEFGRNYRDILASRALRQRQSGIQQLNRLLFGLFSLEKKQQTIQKKQEEIKIISQNKLKRVNGKIIYCGKIKSNLPSQKNWYFENANHFKFVKECGYQQCSICLNKFQSDQVTSELLCKHAFHTDCIHKWLKTSDNCPLCRKNFKEHTDYKNMDGYPKKKFIIFDYEAEEGLDYEMEEGLNYEMEEGW